MWGLRSHLDGDPEDLAYKLTLLSLPFSQAPPCHGSQLSTLGPFKAASPGHPWQWEAREPTEQDTDKSTDLEAQRSAEDLVLPQTSS